MNLSAINSIMPLDSSNFKTWKSDIEITLGLMDLDIAILSDAPNPPAANASVTEKNRFAKWEKANRLSLMIIKKCISPNLLGANPESDNAKTFLSNVTAKFKDSDKAETADLMQKFTNMKYEGDGKIREFILSMSNLANKLKTLDVPLPDTFVVHQILSSHSKSFIIP